MNSLSFIAFLIALLSLVNCQLLPEISLTNFYQLNPGDIRLGKSKFKDIDGNHYYFLTFTPTADKFVSREMLLEGGHWDEHFNMFFQHLWAQEMLRLKVSQADPTSLKVLDVGLNFGAFALFTASLKCEVWAFEMQPHIFTLVDIAMRLSGYRNRVHMYNNAVYERGDIIVYFNSFKTNFGQTMLRERSPNSQAVTTLRIEDVVIPALAPSSSSSDEVLSPENEIFFMKMDIELSEPYALLGMQSLLLEGRIRHIAIEAFTPLLLSIFYKIGYTCDIYDDFTGESGCFWPRNLDNENCSFATYDGIENFYRTYEGGMTPHCSLKVEDNRTRYVNKNRTIKINVWKYVNKFVRIKNETFLLSKHVYSLTQTFDDHVYYLSEGRSFLIVDEDRARVDALVVRNKIKLEEISYADFFFNFLLDPNRNEFISKLLEEVVDDQLVRDGVHSHLPTAISVSPVNSATLFNASYFDTMHVEVHVSFRSLSNAVEQTTAFQYGRDNPYEYALEKCVAYGFVNRGVYQLERFAIIIEFDGGAVKLNSGFESSSSNGGIYDLDLDRCAQYLADRLIDYYCTKMASMAKEGVEPWAVCNRREEQLQTIASEYSSLLTVSVYLSSLWGSPMEILLDWKNTSPEHAASSFCIEHLPGLIGVFLSSVGRNESVGESSFFNEQERLSCQSEFERHLKRMIAFIDAIRTEKDVEFLLLRITDAASPT